MTSWRSVLLVIAVFSAVALCERAYADGGEGVSSRGDRPISSAWTETIEQAASDHLVSGYFLVLMADCESKTNPRAVGNQGEVGLFQLKPGSNGLLTEFYRQGFRNPWSASEQADFTAGMISDGYGRYWSCWWTLAGKSPPWWR